MPEWLRRNQPFSQRYRSGALVFSPAPPTHESRVSLRSTV